MSQERLKAIPELVHDAVLGSQKLNIYESEFGGVVPLVIYDHDWQFHILVQEWNNFDDRPKWTFSLWFIGSDNETSKWETATKVRNFPDHQWDDGNIPYVASALIVEEWRRNLQAGSE